MKEHGRAIRKNETTELREKPKLILIYGSPRAGKTILCKELAATLDNLQYIPFDYYYVTDGYKYRPGFLGVTPPELILAERVPGKNIIVEGVFRRKSARQNILEAVSSYYRCTTLFLHEDLSVLVSRRGITVCSDEGETKSLQRPFKPKSHFEQCITTLQHAKGDIFFGHPKQKTVPQRVEFVRRLLKRNQVRR